MSDIAVLIRSLISAKHKRHIHCTESFIMTTHQSSSPFILCISFALFILLNSANASLAISTNEKNMGEGSGEMELTSINTQHPSLRAALLIASEATMQVSGMIAMVELTQHFANDSDEWVEGRYVFPLPENAAVDGMELRIGKRVIKGLIKEKQQAKKMYQQAKSAGKKAALLEQHRPNMFSQQIANIAPHEKITVKLRYLQTIDYRQGVFSLRFPMTITPRYIPPQSGSVTNSSVVEESAIAINKSGWGMASPTAQVPDADLMTPPISATANHLIDLTVLLDAGLPLAEITSAYHNIVVTKSNQQHRISLSHGKVSMDRDFVLSWRATASATPRAAVFNETIAGDDYSLIMLMPPSVSTEKKSQQRASIPKEMIFIIDTSGSMGGTSIRQAKAGLKKGLQHLNATDRFNIIEFNSNYSLFYTQPVNASKSNVQQALAMVDNLQAGGGTEILPALTTAFQQDSQQTHLKQIVFITDGSIGNEEQLLTSIRQNIKASRLFMVGIGSAPNSFFMRKAAEIGRGSFTYIGDINEVGQKMTSLFNAISSPVMRDITVTDSSINSSINSANSAPIVGETNLEIFPSPIADLYAGEPLMISLHKDYEISALTITGTHQGQLWKETLALSNGKQHSGVAKIWARNKIASLVDNKRRDKSTSAQERLKQAIIDVALNHQLMSPYTSFVAVEEKISRPITKSVVQTPVANPLAKGQSLTSLSYPQTATSLWLHMLLGSISLLATPLFKWFGGNKKRSYKKPRYLLRKKYLQRLYSLKKRSRKPAGRATNGQ
jgi:Ca-activated chloride channel family protein